MKKNVLGRVLGLSLALVMGVSTPISSFAQADTGEVFPEVIEQSEEEITFEEETVTEFAEASEEVEPDVVIVEDGGLTEEDNDTQADDKVAESEVVIEDENDEEDSLEAFTDSSEYDVQEDDSADAEVADLEESSTEVAELKAAAKTVTYYVSFENIEGAVPAAGNYEYDPDYKISVNYGETLDLSKYIYSKKGYTFSNWTYEIDGNTYSVGAKDKVKNLTEVQDTIVSFTANWKANTNKITYKLDGGKQAKGPSKFVTGTNVQLNVPTKKGFIFDYWAVKVDGKSLDDETLWNVYDAESKVLLGAEHTDVLNGNLELTAVYKDIEYNIVFCASDGSEFERQPERFGMGSPIRYSEPIDFYYAARELKLYSTVEMGEFDAITGFSKKPGGKADFVIGKDYSKLLDTEGVIKLYPVVEKKTCLINYDLNGGKLTKPVCTFKAGKKTTLPKAKRAGYKFIGWVADGYEYDEDPFIYRVVKTYDPDYDEYDYQYYVTGIKAGVTGNVSVLACFEPIYYRIYLSPNASGVKRYVYDDEGDAHIKNVNGKKIVGFYTIDGECDDLYYDEWFRKGYNLVGLSASSKAKSDDDCIYVDEYIHGRTGDINLYCVWSPITYSVSFCTDADIVYSLDGEEEWGEIDISNCVPSYQLFHYGMTYTLPTPKVPGCTFDRWLLYNIDSDEPGISISKKNKKWYKVKADNTADLCFIARFKDNRYTLNLDPNGGIYTRNGEEYKKAFDLAGKQLNPNAEQYTIEGLIDSIPENLSREGYVLRGLYLDKKGKKPLPLDYRLLSGKVGAKVTLYAVWDKKK
jgi:hypothetical protein